MLFSNADSDSHKYAKVLKYNQPRKGTFFEACDGCGDQTQEHEGKFLTILGTPGFFCKSCQMADVQADGEEAWWYADDYDVPLVKPTLPKPTVDSKPYVYSPTQYVYARCNHNLTPFKVAPNKNVYLSGSMSIKSKAEGPMPDTAIYLDSGWLRDIILTNDTTSTLEENDLRVMYVKWADHGVLELAQLDVAVRFVITALDRGDNVEIGCVGGHGRTGTLAAAVCVGLGAAADDALMHVWDDYCNKAVETTSQEALVFAYETWRNVKLDKEVKT